LLRIGKIERNQRELDLVFALAPVDNYRSEAGRPEWSLEGCPRHLGPRSPNSTKVLPPACPKEELCEEERSQLVSRPTAASDRVVAYFPLHRRCPGFSPFANALGTSTLRSPETAIWLRSLLILCPMELPQIAARRLNTSDHNSCKTSRSPVVALPGLADLGFETSEALWAPWLGRHSSKHWTSASLHPSHHFSVARRPRMMKRST